MAQSISEAGEAPVLEPGEGVEWEDDEDDELLEDARRSLAEWVKTEARLKEAIEQLPKTLNPAKKRLSPGRQPSRVIRQAALARFNPQDSRGPGGGGLGQVFGTTEALDFPWDDPAGAVYDWWLTSERDGTPKGPPGTSAWSRIANRYAKLHRGDVIFVQRSGGGRAIHHRALPGRAVPNPCLVGLWAVEHVDTKPLAGLGRHVDRIVARPLVLFDEPVRLEHARDDPTFDRLLAHPDVPGSTQTSWESPDGFLLLDEHVALVIALNCSLDYRLFTTTDLVALAADYQRHFTGPTPRQLVRRVTQGRTYLSRLAEAHAVINVWEWLKAQGYRVGDLSHAGNTGWDLLAIAKRPNGTRRHIQIEVKGTDKSGWRGNVMLRQSQHKRAIEAAQGIGVPPEWWLVVVTSAADDTRRRREWWSAARVRDHWPADHVAP